jgi:lipopolysaccharide export LptBFGC system permease protein LptF
MDSIKTRFFIIAALFCITTLLSCNSSEPESGEEQTTLENKTDNKKAKKAKKEPNNQRVEESNALMEHASFNRLAAFLPDDVNGVEGGPFEGWVEGVDGTKYTLAKKSYIDRENKTRVDISIADAGKNTLQSLGLATYWNNKDIDEKSGGSYEKTTIFESFPAFEKCKNRNCDVYFIVDDRFLVGAFIGNVEIKEVYEIFKKFDFDQLKSLPK